MTMTTREPISIENGRVEIHTPENRVWLTRHQIADLFGVFVPAVGSNIRSILKSGILREERVYRRERNRDGGIVELYSLEMIAALAFRLKSGNGRSLPTVACPKGHDDRRRLAAPRHEHDIELKKKNGRDGRSSFIPIPVPRYISSGNLPEISVSRIPCIVPCPESNNRE